MFLPAFATANDRSSRFDRVSKYLKGLNDNELSTLLEQASIVHSGVGGTAVQIVVDGVKVFVKRVPLNELEGRETNIMSTKNLFNLPLYYQYPVGSEGFNVWREVDARSHEYEVGTRRG